MTDNLEARTHRALIEAFADHAARSGGRYEVREGVSLSAGVHPGGFALNVAVPVEDGLEPAAVLETSDAFFEPMGFRYEVWVRAGREGSLEHAAVGAGMELIMEVPSMVAEEPPPARGTVRRLTPGDDLEAFLEVCDDAFVDDAPDASEMLRANFAMPERWLTDDISFAIAYDGGSEPLAAGVIQLGSEDGYIPWVGTKEKARRRGLGAAVTADLTRWAFDRGATLASLQSTEMAVGAYRSVGYREIGLSYRMYSYPVAG